MKSSYRRFHRPSVLLLASFLMILGSRMLVHGDGPSTQPADLNRTARISGTVTDAATGKPLYFANVFLTGTTLGAASDSLGHYAIENVPPGTFEVVATMMGYEPRSVRITVRESDDLTCVFNLSAAPIQGESVSVSAAFPHEWRRRLQIFQEWFLGNSSNARECTLVNPEVLRFDFHEETQTLTARGEGPLDIENRALGYRITVYLFDFVLRGNADTSSEYWLKFQDLEPENASQERTWINNRRKTYLGSDRHFFKALAEGRLEKEKFKVYECDLIRLVRNQTTHGRKFDPEKRVVRSDGSHRIRFSFDGYLKVIYTGEPESQAYLRYLRDRSGAAAVPVSRDPGQTSWLELNAPSAVINADGTLADPHALTRHGYWAWERFAEELPLDYPQSETAPGR